MNRFILLITAIVSLSIASAAGKSGDKADGRADDDSRPAKVYCTHPEVTFKNENTYQPNTMFMDVPEKYSGWYITRYNWGSTDQPLKVKVQEAGVVTLADLPARAKPYLRDEGWKEVGRFTLYNSVKEKEITYIIMEKFLQEGTYLFDASGNIARRHPLLIRQL
jgi:hypothetical protein